MLTAFGSLSSAIGASLHRVLDKAAGYYVDLSEWRKVFSCSGAAERNRTRSRPETAAVSKILLGMAPQKWLVVGSVRRYPSNASLKAVRCHRRVAHQRRWRLRRRGEPGPAMVFLGQLLRPKRKMPPCLREADRPGRHRVVVWPAPAALCQLAVQAVECKLQRLPPSVASEPAAQMIDPIKQPAVALAARDPQVQNSDFGMQTSANRLDLAEPYQPVPCRGQYSPPFLPRKGRPHQTRPDG